MFHYIFALFMIFTPVSFADPGVDAAPAADAPAEQAAEDETAAPADTQEAPADGKGKAKVGKADLPDIDVPEDDEAALEDVRRAFDAAATGKWALFAVILIGLGIFAYNRFFAKDDEGEKTEG